MAEWTRHDGRNITASPGALVDVLHRDGSVSLHREVPRQGWAWAHLGTPCDIVGWRPTTPPPGAPGTDGPPALPVQWTGADGTSHEISLDYAARIAKWVFDTHGDVPQVDAVINGVPGTDKPVTGDTQ